MLERSMEGDPEIGDAGKFKINWSFSIDSPYEYEIVLIQFITVNVSVEACSRHGLFRPYRCQFTYFEKIATVPANAESVKSKDTWESPGFPVLVFVGNNPNIRASRSTCGNIVMRGRVRAFKVNKTLTEIVNKWEKNRKYTDPKPQCYGLTWTAGGFPSAKEFRHFDNTDWIVEEEEEETKVRARWGCPPKQETKIDIQVNGDSLRYPISSVAP